MITTIAVCKNDVIYVAGDRKLFDLTVKRYAGDGFTWEFVEYNPLLPKPIPLLPAPKIAGLLPAPRNDSVICLPPPVPQIVAIDGFSQDCTVVRRFQKWGKSWVTVKTQIGKHLMERTVKASEVR